MIDPLGKAILETLMGDDFVRKDTLRRTVQFKTGCDTQSFWQRLDTLQQMEMVDEFSIDGDHIITDKGRQFYLNDGVTN